MPGEVLTMKRKLTEASIPPLRTSLPQEDVFHVSTPGGGLRVTKEGRKTWFLLYYSPVTGKKRRLTIGEHPSGKKGEPRYLTLKQFETDYQILRGKIAEGKDPQSVAQETGLAPRRISPEALLAEVRSLFPDGVIEGTMGALLVDYFTAIKAQLAPRTFFGYRSVAKTWIVPRFAKTPVSSFGEEDVRALLTDVSKKAPQCVREVKKVLSCAFQWARAHVPGIKSNPAQAVPVTVPKGQRDRWLTDDELGTFFQTLPRMKEANAADCHLLIMAALCRPGEAAAARAEDLILMNGERVWRIPDTKNGRDFLIPLTGLVGEVLLRRSLAVGGQGPLFWVCNETGSYPHKLQESNVNFRKLSQLDNVRPHDWRRTGRTHLSSLGIREEVAEAVLNHAKENLKQTYNLYEYWSERKEALRLWHEKLQTIRERAALRAA
jgi:integrase